MQDTPAAAVAVHLWSLSEDVIVEHDGENDQVVLKSRWGVDYVKRPCPSVQEALRRMELGPVSLANAAERHVDLYAVMLPALSRLSHLVVRTLSVDDLRGPLLSVLPVAHDAPLALVWLPGQRPVRLPRHVVLTRLDSGLSLEAVGGRHMVVLHRPEAALVVAMLAWPVTPDKASASLPLPPEMTEGIIRYLAAAGMAAPVDDAEYGAEHGGAYGGAYRCE
ncbi:NADH oxidase [Streptomyces cinerochromogenes]|uniref:NADH oxidase n=1 Tax=Streptomyces cinerochromogenes TaxID=66422 RepID=UPI0033BDEEE5